MTFYLTLFVQIQFVEMSSIFLRTNIFFNIIVVEEFMIIALLEKTEQQKLYHFMA